jgi:hypothetical protein
VGDDQIRSDIADAFDAAVDATLAYLAQRPREGFPSGPL